MSWVASVITSGKMTATEYRMIHYWVESKMGKPMWCWRCWDRTRPRYAWANRSGEYRKNIFDWDRLCYRCHQLQDKYGNRPKKYVGDTCKYGHPITDRTLVEHKIGSTICRTCKNLTNAQYRNRKAKELL